MQDRKRQQPLSLDKKTYFLWSIIIFVLILDASLANLGNLVSTNFSTGKIYLYSLISIISIVGQFYILRFLKQKNLVRKTKMKLNFGILFKVVSGVQYALAGILVITLV
jgi:hypothetical protein